MITSIDKALHRHFLLKHPFYKTSADDILKWAPFGFLFLADLFGAKTKSGWKKQVLTAGAAEAIKYFLSDSLKKLTQERRPAPYTGTHSFPSGHTCTSFSTAEMLHSELKESLPVLSYSGYVAATAVATIRIMKNRHWLKDVAVGTAVGIISTRLAYALINKLARRRRSKIQIDDNEKISSHLRKETNQIVQ
jgi:membrane-associated phospholipid phosphatase